MRIFGIPKDALRAAHGQHLEVFVLNHGHTDEAVMVSLSDTGPSLAAAFALASPPTLRAGGILNESGLDKPRSTSLRHAGSGDLLLP